MKSSISPVSDNQHAAYIVEEQANPSTDFFVLPALLSAGLRVVRCGFRDVPPAQDLDGAVVIFVRYIPPAWLKLVRAERKRIRLLVYFMDDDVLDVSVSAGMSWRYRHKLALLAASKFGWMKRQGIEMWVSTPHLQNKYSEWQPRLVLPTPVAIPSDICRIFYHGSSSHMAEIEWLHPVMEQVLHADERLTFGIVGNRDVYRLYKDLPRVNVVHPMNWVSYQHYLYLQGRQIGLAPLLDTPFNRARSYTKFFDITRCGAVGIYSSGGPYTGVVRHGVNGLLVKQDRDAWVRAILDISRDAEKRKSMLQNAEQTLTELANAASSGYAELLKPLTEKSNAKP